MTHTLPTTIDWLMKAGYDFHCFISWAHTANQDMLRCAQRLEADIKASLADLIPDPKVFLDNRIIRGGDDWRSVLRNSLCRSVAMVAICAPIYYDPAHRWCGIEWAAMRQLRMLRLPNEPFNTIIPILFRILGPLPSAVSEIQYLDISSIQLRGRNYYRTNEYRAVIGQITDKIVQIAIALHRNTAAPGCDHFVLPAESAFADYNAPLHPAPLIGSL